MRREGDWRIGAHTAVEAKLGGRILFSPLIPVQILHVSNRLKCLNQFSFGKKYDHAQTRFIGCMKVVAVAAMASSVRRPLLDDGATA